MVKKYLSDFYKMIFIFVTVVSLTSCCPKDGVDRSWHDDVYVISMDIFDLSVQQPINHLDSESKLVLVLKDSTRKESTGFKQADDFHNRYVFKFNSEIKDEDVSTIEVKLIDYKDQVVNYQTIKKTPYQRNPTPIAMNTWDSFFCDLNPIEWIIPSAHALSCKPKAGSQITYRASQLFSLGLYPEDP